MKQYKRIKYLLTVICMLAAGICYSCSRQTGKVDLDGQVLMDLQIGETVREAEGQNGLILAEAEPGEENGGESGSGFLEESLSRQTESVRFYVHICGEVNHPGVYEMEPGSRIFQAVEMAGGFTEEAAGDYLNMAMEISDGMKITVPSREAAEASDKERNPGSPTDSPSEETWIVMPENTGGEIFEEPAIPPKVNLNTAGKEELMTLRGIGEAKAEAIIRYREEQGPFRSIEEVMNISGIKEAAFEKIKDRITV